MYESYWNLNKKPFEIGNDPSFYFPAQSHQAVLLKLRYLLENRRGNGVLFGESGTGKSLLVTMLMELRRKGSSIGPLVEINMPQFKSQDLLFYLAEKLVSFPTLHNKLETGRLPFQSEEQPPVYKAFSSIERILKHLADEKQKPVLVLEGSEQIRDLEVWSVLKSLMGLEYRGNPLISLLLTMTASKIVRPVPIVEDYLETVAELHPFDESETAGYICHRLEKAGAKRTDIFTPKSLETIYQLTDGIPRKINRLCDMALLVGFAEQLEQIDDDLVNNLN